MFATSIFFCLLIGLVNFDNQSAESANLEAPKPTDLDPSWLAVTKHPQTGLLSRTIRPEESAGYFAILNHARILPLAQLKKAAKEFQAERLTAIRRDPNFRFYFRKPNAEFPTFVDLYHNPATYHGRLVTFRGHLRRLVSFDPGENPYGLEQLHEAWLYVDDAQQNPVVVVCSELPPKIPTGTDILIDFVSATGYFFKRYGYEDRTGQPRFAPLILAKRLEWSPPRPRWQLPSSGTIFGVTVGATAILVAIWLMWLRKRETVRRTLVERSINLSSDSVVEGNLLTDKTDQGGPMTE